MVPRAWEYQLARLETCGANVYRIALYLLDETWRSGSNRVKSNGALEKHGVSRWGKQRALKQLRQIGLIKVEQQPRRSPIVTVRFAGSRVRHKDERWCSFAPKLVQGCAYGVES
jgi:hypothetical protein